MKTKHSRHLRLLVACFANWFGYELAITEAHGQAYCALRDPVDKIHVIFNDDVEYRSIVRTVNEKARAEVGQRLPFDLHFTELGKHTLYVVTRNGAVQGIVHARSEKGRWGLVEIVWALDLQMRVIDFRYQRCRDRQKSILEGDTFKSMIVGKGFTELRSMLDASASKLSSALPGISQEAEPLAITTLRSALKVITVTESVWGADIEQLRKASQAAAPGSSGLGSHAPALYALIPEARHMPKSNHLPRLQGWH